ncbi:MAG TPA: hypothetical protein V6C71_04835 [Coleofasciculaceae cyanobacterium]
MSGNTCLDLLRHGRYTVIGVESTKLIPVTSPLPVLRKQHNNIKDQDININKAIVAN